MSKHVPPAPSGAFRPISGSALVAALLLLAPGPAQASFHVAAISEVVTSHGGDASIQFVEIVMDAAGQNLVGDTVLAAFDEDGEYVQDVLVVPDDVPNGDFAFWLMGTEGLEEAAGVAPDFVIPAALPTGGGMLCWGAPGVVAPDPSSWDHGDPENYVDCLAYGSYRGPANSKTGIPTPIDGDGHAMFRAHSNDDNVFDFVCTPDAFPENNAFASGFLPGDRPCPSPGAFTLAEPLAFSGPGDGGTISGTIHPAAPAASEIDRADCIFEDCPPSFDALFFQVTLDPGSADLYYAVPRVSPSAAVGGERMTGHLEDGDDATRAPMGLILVGSFEGPTFDDFDMGNQLQGGETSDVLFVSVIFGVLSHHVSEGPVTVDFQLSPFSFDPADSFETETATSVVLPEPGAGLLGAVACCVLAGVARAQARKRSSSA